MEEAAAKRLRTEKHDSGPDIVITVKNRVIDVRVDCGAFNMGHLHQICSERRLAISVLVNN